MRYLSKVGWWYVLPDWPPKDFDYTAALAEQGVNGCLVAGIDGRFQLATNIDENLA